MAQFRAAVARLVKPYRRDVAIGLLATAAANGFAVLIPLAFRAGIDGIVRHSVAAPLLFYGLAVIVLSGCKGWGDYLSHQCIAGMAQRIAYDLRNQIFSHLQSLPPAYFDHANTGDLMSRATSDVEGVRMFIAQSLSTLLEMLCLFTAGLGLMFAMSWQLTLVACVLFPALGYTVVKFRRRIRPRYLAVQEQHGRVATAAGPSGAARDRFVLFITHRIKTLQAADRILVVADGRIVAEGLHKDLLTQGGLYRALYERQCIRESFA